MAKPGARVRSARPGEGEGEGGERVGETMASPLGLVVCAATVPGCSATRASATTMRSTAVRVGRMSPLCARSGSNSRAAPG
jgi:hypothetical protein